MEIVSGYKTRQVRKKWPRSKISAFLAIFLLFGSSGGYTYAALNKPLPTATLSTVSLSPTVAEVINLPWPAGGQAAIGSLEDGLLAVSSDNQAEKPMASMTKVVTALALMKKSPITPGQQGPAITLDAIDTGYYSSYLAKQGSVAPVALGQTITQYQAMQAMLVASANNLADSLVRHNFGTMEAYLDYASSMLKEMGLSQTRIADATGFSPNSVSTPSELIVLGQKLLGDPVLAGIVDMEQVSLPGIGVLRNTNQILGDPDVVGIKTGTTDEAGSCLLFAAHHRPDALSSKMIIGVIMGEPGPNTLFRDSRNLLAAARQGFGVIEVLPAGSVVGQLITAWEDQTELVTTDPLRLFAWRGKSYTPDATWSKPVAPTENGRVVGKVALNGLEIGVNVVTKESITPPSNFWRLVNYF